MKISKREAQQAKDNARKEKQGILGQSKKNLSANDKNRIRALNAVIKAADDVIEGQ